MSYDIDNEATELRNLRDAFEKLQADFLSTQFSVGQGNIDSGESTIPAANPAARGGGSSSGAGSFPSRPTVTIISSPSSTQDLDLNTTSGHIFKNTVDKDFTLTFSNPPATGIQQEFEVELTHDGVGGTFTVTLPGSVRQLSTITVPLDARGIYTFRTNDGGVNYDVVQIVSGTTNTGFANVSLSNLVGPVLNTPINFNGNAPTNFIGYTNLVGQTLVNSATGAAWSLPSGDTYEFFINGSSQFAISAAGSAFANGSLNMTSQKIVNVLDPTSNQDAATKKYVDDNIGGNEFVDNVFRINDNLDGTRQLAIETGGIATSTLRTWIAQNASGTVCLLDGGSTQTFADPIRAGGTDGATDWGDSTHHLNQLFTEQVTYRSISGPALSTTSYTTADTGQMINNVPAGDEYLWKIGGTTFIQWNEDANSRMRIRAGAGKELGFVVSTSAVTIGTSGTIEIPVDGGSVGTAAAANTDFGDSVGCIGMYLNTIGSGNPTICFKIDDGTGVDNRWAAIIINRTTGALSGSILT